MIPPKEYSDFVVWFDLMAITGCCNARYSEAQAKLNADLSVMPPKEHPDFVSDVPEGTS